MDHAWFASRYDKGTADYVNCALSEEEYAAFWREGLCAAQEADVHGFEDKMCLKAWRPWSVKRPAGVDTLRYGPLKPKGLRDRERTDPYAVVQLRKDNADGTIYNLVGFQTHLKWPEQRRVFSMIPALKNAEFVRYGVMHRNTYLDSPWLLDRYYRVRGNERLMFAGRSPGWRAMWSPSPPASCAPWSLPAGCWTSPWWIFPRRPPWGPWPST